MELEPILRLKSNYVGQSVDLDYLFASQDIQSEEDVNFLLSLFDLFLTTSPTRLQEITQAANEQNSDQLKKSLHYWKSSSVNVGALKLSALCSSLESLVIKKVIDWLSVDKAHRELENEYQKVVKDIFTIKELYKETLTKPAQ
jgi:HPt (histidine-containing phosphotransfer) domain-containing protein